MIPRWFGKACRIASATPLDNASTTPASTTVGAAETSAGEADAPDDVLSVALTAALNAGAWSDYKKQGLLVGHRALGCSLLTGLVMGAFLRYR